jgi:Ca2+-binding RTX toxin-like protein
MANSVLNLGNLNGSNGFRLNGVAAGDLSGVSVSSAGDINGDGIDDLIIGASEADPNGFSSGSSYVVFGKTGSFNASLNLSTLDGTTGFILAGVAAYDYSGISVSGAGDINGDGIDDLIIGASRADSNGDNSGSSYVLFGKNTSQVGGFDPILNLFNLSISDGTMGFRLDGVAGDQSGISVSGAGDINGDGIDDLIIGAYRGGSFGSSYVVFGKNTSQAGNFSPTLNLSTLDGTTGFRLDGAVFGQAGISVSNAGDINGDGIDDLIIGANRANTSYVVFGKNTSQAGNFSPAINLSTLDGTTGFRLDGVAAQSELGRSVSSAGDINGDGIDDLIVGAYGASTSSFLSGASYVVFGRTSGFGASLNLSTLDGTTGFRLDGAAEFDQAGRSVSSAGDVNGDGIDDLLIGAFGVGNSSGASYVVFGNRAPKLDLNGAAAGINFTATNGVAAAVVDPANLTLADNASTIIGATVKITNRLDGVAESLTADPNGTNISATYNFGTGILSLSGSDTIANYQKVLRTVTYNNTASNPNVTARTIEFTVDDGALHSNTSAVAITTLTFPTALPSGAGGNKTFTIDSTATTTITAFGGVGKSNSQSAAVLAEVDTLKFQGTGLTVRNLLLTQNGANLELTFEGIATPKVILQNFALENLENLGNGIGNILFNGETTIQDQYDVFDANSTSTSVTRSNVVTFLNDLNNTVSGRDNSTDGINGQGGDDRLDGKGSSDLLRGGLGNDTLIGGSGADMLVGNEGNDSFDGGSGNDVITTGAGSDRILYNTNRSFQTSDIGIDTITDFAVGTDKIVLDKTTFTALTSAAGNGFSVPSNFAIVGSDAAAATSTARIVYNSSNGKLFYNSNGSSSGFGSNGTGGQFASLTSAPALSATDFVVQQ